MYYFCTYFDRNYLLRGIALYESLVAHVDEFRLYVLCFDNDSYSFLKQRGYKQVVPISQEEFEEGDDDLVRCKADRTRLEYFFTCTPSLPLYILNNYNDVDLITYLDTDLFFFASPEPIFREFGENSILIIGHRFSEKNIDLERFGKYNVGFLSFRNDQWGRKCLEWWRSKCIEWCYDRKDGNRFADQKYLDDWPNLFEKLCELKHKGANLAPWNIDNFRLNKVGKNLFVDEDSLLFFHFHGFNKKSWSLFNLGTKSYCSQLSRELIVNVYKVYINKIEFIARNLKLNIGFDRNYSNNTNFIYNLISNSEKEEIIFYQKYFPLFSLSRILRPLSATKRLFKMMTAMFLTKN